MFQWNHAQLFPAIGVTWQITLGGGGQSRPWVVGNLILRRIEVRKMGIFV